MLCFKKSLKMKKIYWYTYNVKINIICVCLALCLMIKNAFCKFQSSKAYLLLYAITFM